MKTLKIKMYEGKELHYTKDGEIQNKTQVIKLSEWEFRNKFLKHCNTLGSLFVLEEVYEAKYVPKGQSKCTAVSSEEFDVFVQLLKEAGVKKVVMDPMAEENKKLIAQNDVNEQELKGLRREMDELRKMITPKAEPIPTEENPKEVKESSIPDPVKLPKKLKDMNKKELTEEARKVGIQLTGQETKAIIINKLS